MALETPVNSAGQRALSPHINALPSPIVEGGLVSLELITEPTTIRDVTWRVIDPTNTPAATPPKVLGDGRKAVIDTTAFRAGRYEVEVEFLADDEGEPQRRVIAQTHFEVAPQAINRSSNLAIALKPSGYVETADMALWAVIRLTTDAISFHSYKDFIDGIMCGGFLQAQNKVRNPETMGGGVREFRSSLPFPGVDAFNLLKTATEVFLMTHCGVNFEFKDLLIDESVRWGDSRSAADVQALLKQYLAKFPDPKTGPNATLPYLDLIRRSLGVGLRPLVGGAQPSDSCSEIIVDKLTRPCLLELIWSYWHEEGMLVQTMNAISLRFQNKRSAGASDALARLDIDPLRPLNNFMWGYIQDEQHRLTVVRRAYEYDHHYGISLHGKAVPQLHAADSRSRFLEAFHHLLYLSTVFYQEADDTTVVPDGFPLLHAIKDVHLLLAEGAHNQFGDLPSTARQEMLMQQWLLGRPEMREFLGGRIMVPYRESWMDRVDTVKKLHSWTDTTITHFHDLARYGEQLLLSLRYGNWSDVNSSQQSGNWARYWRAEVQGYIHAYRAATGVDLAPSDLPALDPSAERNLPPSVHLRRRLEAQQVRQR